jgi:hypothetical protein
MLIPKGDGTYMCGPLDVACILHDVAKDRYHAAFFYEKPFPGEVPSVEETCLVRLKSKMHHTEGAPTLEEAQIHLDELLETLTIDEENIWRDAQPWDGGVGIVWVVENWK